MASSQELGGSVEGVWQRQQRAQSLAGTLFYTASLHNYGIIYSIVWNYQVYGYLCTLLGQS